MNLLYLGKDDVHAVGFPWERLVAVISDTVALIDTNRYAQPLKPYLRFGNPANRIIAMPAYVGGDIHAAGMKWIASFPGNHAAGLPRAHSVTILNDADTGAPSALLNTASVSSARTAAVSGLMLKMWLERRASAHRLNDSNAEKRPLRIGIIGFGPIGRLHLDMCTALFGAEIDHIFLTDPKGVELPPAKPEWSNRISVAEDWKSLYSRCNVIVTCTASPVRYIDVAPAPETLLLHVSLRDYTTDALKGIETVVVDNWSEVCRENTDIELLHREAGLRESDCISLGDVVCRNALQTPPPDKSVLFCPMGMAAFDIAIAHWYAGRAASLGIGTWLQ